MDQDQRTLAGDAKAPKQPPVTRLWQRVGGARQRQQQRRAQALDCGIGFTAHGHRPQPDAGEGCRHQRCALHMAGLAVLVDHGAQSFAVAAGGGGKGQLCLAVPGNTQAHGDGADRVQSGGQLQHRISAFGQGFKQAQWRLGTPIPTEPARAVDVDAYALHLFIAAGQKMRRHQPVLARQTRCARKHQRLMLRQPLRADKEVGESRM